MKKKHVLKHNSTRNFKKVPWEFAGLYTRENKHNAASG
jgi:hypothetical protein